MGFDLGLMGFVLIIAALMMLLMRWVFKPSRPRTGRPDHGPDADLGLLTPIRAGVSRSQAISIKNQLSENGVRCSLSRLELDRYDVLVFRPDLDKAGEVLGR